MSIQWYTKLVFHEYSLIPFPSHDPSDWSGEPNSCHWRAVLYHWLNNDNVAIFQTFLPFPLFNAYLPLPLFNAYIRYKHTGCRWVCFTFHICKSTLQVISSRVECLVEILTADRMHSICSTCSRMSSYCWQWTQSTALNLFTHSDLVWRLAVSTFGHIYGWFT